MPNNCLSVLYKRIIQVENKNVGLKVWGGGGHKHTIAPPPLPTPVYMYVCIYVRVCVCVCLYPSVCTYVHYYHGDTDFSM